MAKIKKTNKKDLASKGKAELADLIEELKLKLVKQKADLASGKIKNLSLIGKQKQQLARLKTFLRQKELNEDA